MVSNAYENRSLYRKSFMKEYISVIVYARQMCIVTCITIDHVNMIISSANTRCIGKVCSIACQKRWRRTVYMRRFFSHVIVIGIGFTSCLYILYGKVIKMEVVVSATHSNIMPKRLVCMGI
jgi:hypothetical protein